MLVIHVAGDASGRCASKRVVARIMAGHSPNDRAPDAALRGGRASHHEARRKSYDDGCTGNTHGDPPELLFATQRMMGGFDQIKSVARSG
jgi:hypothetical protein